MNSNMYTISKNLNSYYVHRNSIYATRHVSAQNPMENAPEKQDARPKQDSGYDKKGNFVMSSKNSHIYIKV